ncbi:hypothetical protein BCR44DRAFT_33614, partial [Catenaria anguillulae PL171]
MSSDWGSVITYFDSSLEAARTWKLRSKRHHPFPTLNEEKPANHVLRCQQPAYKALKLPTH